MAYGTAIIWTLTNMHFEILIEDQSGKVALEALLPRILTAESTFSIHPYKGIGHIPKGLVTTLDPKKRVLLNQLPRLLVGYGKAFEGYPDGYRAAVIVICDLDSRDRDIFLAELEAVFDNCDPKPNGCICLCIEEGEAWLLGDKDAVINAYPTAKKAILNSYVNDSICNTWETLADAVYTGGAVALAAKGASEVGRLKSEWATEIAPLVNIEENKSPSFQFFLNVLRELSDDD